MDKVTFSKWDSTDYLTDQEMIDTYIQEVAADGDIKMLISAISDARRAQKKHGLSPTISTSLSGFAQLLDRLGLEMVVKPKTSF